MIFPSDRASQGRLCIRIADWFCPVETPRGPARRVGPLLMDAIERERTAETR